VRRENIILLNFKGVVYQGRTDGMNPYKAAFAQDTPLRSLPEAVAGADVLVGLSVKGAFTPQLLATMNARPIIFALANPEPEIDYSEARRARPDAIVATGRSDFPNQVNNVLGFPYIFRGALDVRATQINEAMKMAAVRALAELAREDVPDAVIRAYGGAPIQFGAEYIIPKPFDTRVLLKVVPRRNGVSTVAGLYLMLLKNRTLLFADCTVNVEPDAATLAEIAILASEMAHFFGMDPRVAMLSFSNFGNARHALSDKVAQAVKIARGRKLELFIEGEMHADTAVVEEMLMGMFPFNRLGGSANVLIFPDLNSGNISYKLLERLGEATAIGPLLIGLSKPFNVLPRNTDMENVVNVIAVTVAQAQHLDYTQPLVRSPAHG
jgi:hypothetical protein